MHQSIPRELTEAEEHAASILRIPNDQLPDFEARRELVNRALDGHDVYAYTPAGSDRFNVWVRQPRADEESRFRPMEWAGLWHAGLQPDKGAGDE